MPLEIFDQAGWQHGELKLAIYLPNMSVLYGQLVAYPPDLARYTAINLYIHSDLGR